MRRVTASLAVMMLLVVAAVGLFEPVTPAVVAEAGGEYAPGTEEPPVNVADAGGDYAPQEVQPPVVLTEGGSEYAPVEVEPPVVLVDNGGDHAPDFESPAQTGPTPP
jgi:hypothetical protein